MPIPVFLSYPKPFLDYQDKLLTGICATLSDRGLEPRTLGVNEYDSEVPLAAVRRLLLESNGVLTIALRRYHVERGAAKPTHKEQARIDGVWFTSPWPHVETSMGFQLGLPIMVVREEGVRPEGVLAPSVVGRYVLEVDGTRVDDCLSSRQWRDPLAGWERDVRTVARNRGLPPKLY